jgi:phospholipase/lecithinase/hemolysin
LVFTYNFAWGGATIDSRMVPPGQGISLTDEVNSFLSKFARRPQSTPWQTRNTLFSVWIGINDIAYTYNRGGDRHVFSDKLLDSYFALVEQLYNSGARSFLFISVPPVDRSPVMLARPVWEQAIKKAVILGYNSKLWKRIEWFERKHSDVTVWRWDSHAVFTAILDNPGKYGFRDATSHGRSSGHFWGNAYHPGSELQYTLFQPYQSMYAQ